MNATTQEDPTKDVSPSRIEPGLKQTSMASTISFVFGVGALLTLGLVRPSMILSVPAILFGHIAKLRLRSSNGELVGWGKARIGKLLGYFCLVISLCLFFYLTEYRLLIRGALESERTAVVNTKNKFSPGRLGEVERKLAKDDSTSFGNNKIAEGLADAFRRELRASLNKVLTHRDDKGLGLDTSGISCYCQFSDLETEPVCFIAAVPELSGYNGAAESILRNAAWQSALLAVQELQQSPQDANVGLPDGLEQESQNADIKMYTGKVVVGLMETSECELVISGNADPASESFPAPHAVEAGSGDLPQWLSE